MLSLFRLFHLVTRKLFCFHTYYSCSAVISPVGSYWRLPYSQPMNESPSSNPKAERRGFIEHFFRRKTTATAADHGLLLFLMRRHEVDAGFYPLRQAESVLIKTIFIINLGRNSIREGIRHWKSLRFPEMWHTNDFFMRRPTNGSTLCC